MPEFLARFRSCSRALIAAGLLVGWTACGTEAPVDAAPEEPVEVSASVDRAVATTGDVITYTLAVERDKEVEIEMPPMGSEIAGFRIIDLGEETTSEGPDRVQDQWWYELRADLVGSYVLPSAEVRWRPSPEGEWTTVETSQIFVEVASVLPEGAEMPEDIRDIKPLRPEPTALPILWIALLVVGALGLAVLGIGGILWWVLRKKPVAPPTPPHEVAYAALNALRDVDTTDLEAVRQWYFDLSEVLRAYVEGRFGLNATDLTTEEILTRMTELKRLSDDNQQRLEGFLVDTDQVKYAAQPPSESDVEQCYERALSFVESTAHTLPEEEAAHA